MFYPNDPDKLRAELTQYLQGVDEPAACPKAMITPHAGTIYSGPVAATAYARLKHVRDRIARVVLLGPAHRVFVRGLAAPSVGAFRTPLGDIPLDRAALDELVARFDQVATNDEAHRQEHSLEVHLPFLQLMLTRFTLVPLVVGREEPARVAEVIDHLWGGDETLIVISSDLSHFHDYATAKRIDGETSGLIEAMRYEELNGERACGVYPVSGLLFTAKERGMKVDTVDLRNSGDTAGKRREVVGYGSYLVD